MKIKKKNKNNHNLECLFLGHRPIGKTLFALDAFFNVCKYCGKEIRLDLRNGNWTLLKDEYRYCASVMEDIEGIKHATIF